MRDLHARGLEREDPRARQPRMRLQVDEDVEVIGLDLARGRAIGQRGEVAESGGDAFEALGPRVAARSDRVEVHVEALAVVPADRFPHHLAHDVVAQVGGEVADAQASGLALGISAARRAIDVLRRLVVGLGEPVDRARVDVEEQEQVQELLERVDERAVVVGAVALEAQPVEHAVDRGEIALQLVELERLHREQQRVRAVRLELPVARRPVAHAARRVEDLAGVLPRRGAPRLARQHALERGERGRQAPLLLEQHAEVEVGVDQPRIERKRVLVRARRRIGVARELVRDAEVVVELGIERLERDRMLEDLDRVRTVADL